MWFFAAKQHKDCRKLHVKLKLNEQLTCLHHACDVKWDSFTDQTHYAGSDFVDNTADFISNPQSLAESASGHTRVRTTVCEVVSIQPSSPWCATHTWLLWLKLFMTNACSIYVNLSSTVLWGHELNSIALNLGCWKQSTMALQTMKRLDFCTCAFLLVWGLVITPSDSPRCIIHAGIHRKSLACGDGWGAFAQKNIWFGYKYHIMKEQRSRVKGKEHDNQRWKIFTLVALRYSVSNSDQHQSAVGDVVQPAWFKLECPWSIYGGLRFVLDLLCIKTE